MLQAYRHACSTMVGPSTTQLPHADEAFSYRTAEIYHFNDGGKIAERWAFSDDTKAITDFFSQYG